MKTVKKSQPQWLCLFSAIACIVFFTLHDTLGMYNYPGYEWARQAVSNMTATESPSFTTSTRFAAVFIMTACLCATLVFLQTRGRGNRRLQRGTTLFSATICTMGVGYALFPLDKPGYGGEPGGSVNDFIHFFVVTGLVALLGLSALALIALSGLRENGARWLSIVACVAMAGLLSALVGLVIWGVDVGLFGLFERIGIYGAVVFQALLGIYVFSDRYPSLEGVSA